MMHPQLIYVRFEWLVLISVLIFETLIFQHFDNNDKKKSQMK